MNGRKMEPVHVERMKALFAARGLNYEFPALNRNIIAKRVVESGPQLIAGAAARLTTEVFVWIDREWESPRWRMEAFRFLHEQMRAELREKGMEEVHAWIPPEIERAFSRRLKLLGWQKPAWTNYFCEIG